MNIRFVSRTDTGKVRSQNEDAVGDPEICGRLLAPDALNDRGFLFAVADGMGGHADGEVASAMAIDLLFRHYYAASGDLRNALLASFTTANEAVFVAARERISGRPNIGASDAARLMGTTLVAMAVKAGQATVASVGDSRAYILRDGHLRRITNDHSIVGEQVRAGVLTEEEAKHVAYRNILLRSIGQAADVTPDAFDLVLSVGDVVLLCSDGLHGVVSDEEIREILLTGDIRDAATHLIDRANAHGGPDNISVVIVQLSP